MQHYVCRAGSVSPRLSRSPYHHVIECHSIGRVAQLLKDFRSSKSPGDAGQRGELDCLVSFCQEYQANEIDSLSVDSVEVDRLSQSHQYPEWLLHLLQPHVRNRHPVANSR